MTEEVSLALISFRIAEDLRYLSHAETIRLLQRACTRAEFSLAYSRGFNPRARLSLPLPRSVGVESDDELMCLLLESNGALGSATSDVNDGFCAERMKERLKSEVPVGCEIVEIIWPVRYKSVHAVAATYAFGLREDLPSQDRAILARRIDAFAVDEDFMVERNYGGGRKRRQVNLRDFVEHIEVKGDTVFIRCSVSNAGSARVDEMMYLLGLCRRDLNGPVKRVRVEWDYK